MRNHDPGELSLGDQFFIGTHIIQQISVTAAINRQLIVRIGDDGAVTGEVLGNGRHAGTSKTIAKGARKFGDNIGIAVKSTIANDLAYAPIEIDAWREAQIDIHGAQF